MGAFESKEAVEKPIKQKMPEQKITNVKNVEAGADAGAGYNSDVEMQGGRRRSRRRKVNRKVSRKGRKSRR